MSNELLQKVIDTTNLGTSGSDLSGDGRTLSGTGLLYPDQANRFLDYMWDATILAKAARTIRMRSSHQWLSCIPCSFLVCAWSVP